jgi:hypothetical protein
VSRRSFDDLVGTDLPSDERARLKHVHDLLIAAGPPPELPPALEQPPETSAGVTWLPRRRLAAFAAGFLVADRGDDSSAANGFQTERTVVLGEAGGPLAVVRLGKADESGSYPMLVTVEGLERQPEGDYYSLLMLKKGKPVAVCGTFNVAGGETTTVRFTTGYDFDGYDGLMLAEYRAADHEDHPLLQESL